MDQTTIFLTLIGMNLVTYIPRLLPVWALASKSLPKVIVDWLRYVPVAVLAAMLLPSLLVHEGQIDLRPSNMFLWAAIPTLVVAWKRRSLFGSVVVGMLVVALARLVLGL
jgi:branched-subunit amino acid transport protein